MNRQALIHAARTAVAAVASLLFARLFRLPESYWAAITTIIVMQSTLGAAWTISKQRLVGTAAGAATGALLGAYFSQNVIAFGLGIFALGLICTWLRFSRVAYRYSGITLAVIMLVPHSGPVWVISIHRFLEISIGIAAALSLCAVWPESEPVVG